MDIFEKGNQLLNTLSTKQNSTVDAYTDKSYDLNGYEDVEVTYSIDADTWGINTSQGFLNNARLADGSSNYFDAIESPKKGKDNILDLATDKYKAQQLGVIAEAYGVNFADLTDEHLQGYSNYSTQQMLNQLSGKEVEPFNKDSVYTPTPLTEPVKVKGKILGYDNYGRPLVDLQMNGKSIVTSSRENSNLNTNYSQSVNPIDVNEISNSGDSLQLMIDSAQSSAYSMGARLAGYILPDTYFNDKGDDSYSLADLAENKNGIADELAGTNPLDKAAFDEEMSFAKKDWDKGNYFDSVARVISNPATLGTLASQSAPQMVTGAAGAVAAVATGSIIPIAVGALVNGLDASATVEQEFKKNNNREMNAEEFGVTLVTQWALAGLDIGILKGTTKFIPGLDKIFNKAVDTVEKVGITNFITRAGAALGFSMGGEFVQEGLQSGTASYAGRDLEKGGSVFDFILNKDNAFDATMGALTAGGITTVGLGAGAAINTANKVVGKAADVAEKANKARESSIKSKEVRDIKINDASNADFEKIVKDYDDIDFTKVDKKSITTILDTLSDSFDGLTAENSKLRDAKVAEVVKAARQQGLTIDYSKYVDVQALDAKTVRGSLPSNFDDITTDKQEIAMVKVSEDTGIPLEQVRELASLSKVSTEVKYGLKGGKKGYVQYEQDLDNIKTTLDKTNLTENEVEAAQQEYEGTQAKLLNLYDNQVNKAKAILEGVKQVAETGKDVVVDYGFEGKYNLKQSYLAGTGSEAAKERRRGVFQLIPELAMNIQEMQTIANKHGMELSAEANTLVDDFISAVKSIDPTWDGSYLKNMGIMADEELASSKPSKSLSPVGDVQVTKSKTVAEKPTQDLSVDQLAEVEPSETVRVMSAEATPSVSSISTEPDQQVVKQDLEPKNQPEEQFDDLPPVPEYLNEAPIFEDDYTPITDEEYSYYEEVFNEEEVSLTTFENINFSNIDLSTVSETVKNMITQFNKNKTDKEVAKGFTSTESFETLKNHIKTKANNMLTKGKQFVATINTDIENTELEITEALTNKVDTSKIQAKLDSLLKRKEDAFKSMDAIRESVSQSIKDLRKKFVEREVSVPAVQTAVALDTRLNEIDNITSNESIKYNDVFKASKDVFHLGAVQDVDTDINITEYKSSIGYGSTNTKSFLVKELEFAPALGLLFEFNTKGTPVVNATTAQVVDHSILQLASSPYLFHPMGSSLDSFKLSVDDGNTVASDDIKDAFLNEFGMFRSTVANALGQQILDSLGLQNNNKYRDEYAIMVTNMGNLALTRMESLGLIQSFTANEVREFSGYKIKPDVVNTPNTVKLTMSKEDLRAVKRDLVALDNKYLIKSNPNKKGPLKLKPRQQTEANVKNAKGTVVTKKQLSELNALTQVAYTLNKSLIEQTFYKDGKRNQKVIDNVLTSMGYTWDLDSLPMEAYKSVTGLAVRPKNPTEAHESLLGKNGAIRRELEALLDLYEENYEGDYYFNWFIGSNTRFNMEGTDVNPQTNKHLQRALLRNAQVDLYDKNNIEDMESFKFGLASIFDFANKAPRDYNGAIDALLSVKPEVLREALLSGDKGKLKDIHPVLGIETIGHALVAVNAIEAYQKGGDVFEAELLVEHDATTSGYFIRFLQYANQPTEVLKRVGILFKDFGKTMRNLKTTEQNFLDTYETTVANYDLPPVFSLKGYSFKSATNALNGLVKSTIGTEDGALLRKPQDGAITSALRKLAKPATMIFGYSAGEKKIKEETGKALLDGHLNAYYKRLASGNTDKLTEEETSFARMMLNFAYTLDTVQLTGNPQADKRNALNELKKLLRTKSTSEIVVQLPTQSNDTLLNNVANIAKWKNTKASQKTNLNAVLTAIYSETVGQGVYDSLSTLYEGDVEISKAYNSMYQALGLVYTKLEQEVRDTLTKQYGTKVPVEAYDTAMENLRAVMPRLKTALLDKDNDTIASEVPLLGSRTLHKATGKTYSVRNPFAKGQKYTTTVPKIRVPEAVYAKNIVTAIHGTDAVIAGGTFKDLYDEGITTLIIHDAFQTTAKNSRKVVHTANRLSYETSEQYSVFEQLSEVLTEMENLLISDPALATKVNSIRANIPLGEDLTYDDVETLFKITGSSVKARRDNLFKQPIAIANIGGPEGSTFYSGDTTAQEYADTLGSINYITPEAAKMITTKSLTNRLELFDKLSEGVIEDSKHLKEIREDLATFDDVIFDDMETTVSIVTEQFPSGTYNTKTNKINLSVPAIINHLDSVQSTAVTYAHELYHAITDSLITNRATYGTDTEVRQLQRVYRRALEKLNYKSFLPLHRKPAQGDVKRAKEAWDYVFNNKDSGLSEFVAYAKTNEAFRAALKKVDLYTKEDKSSMTLLEKIVDVIDKLFSVFKGTPFSTVFPGMSDVITGDMTGKTVNMNVLAVVDHVVTRMGNINAKYIKTKNAESAGERAFFAKFKDWMEQANGALSKRIKFLLSFGDKLKLPAIRIGFKDTDTKNQKLLKIARFAMKMIGLSLVSPNTRKGVVTFLSNSPLGIFKGEGFVRTFMRDILTRSKEGQELDSYASLTSMAQSDAMSVTGATFNSLKAAFGRDLTYDEDVALTDVGLSTDLEVLLRKFSLNEIKALLTDKTALIKTAKSLELELFNKIGKRRAKHIALHNYTEALAHYMIYKEGPEVLCINAFQITDAAGMPVGLVEDVDVLVTLKALALTDADTRAAVAALPSKGLQAFLKAHKTFKDTSLDSDGANIWNMVKGWTRSNPTDNLRTKWDLTANQETLEQEGWQLVIEGKNGLGYYKHTYSTVPTRDGSSFASRGAYQASTALHEFSNSSVSDKLTKSRLEDAKVNELNARARKNASILEDKMQKNVLTVEQMMRGSTGLVPILDGKGVANWYSATLNTQQRNEVLNIERRGLNVMSEMMGSLTLWNATKGPNELLLGWLQAEQDKNFSATANLTKTEDKNPEGLVGKDGNRWFLLRPDSPNKHIAEYYGALPLSVRSYIEKGNELAIRDSMINDIFGVPSFALTDTKFANQIAPKEVRKYMALIGTLLMELAKFVKQTVVVRMIPVVIGNITGNISTALVFGINPVTAMRATLRAFRNTREYVKNRQEANLIRARMALGTATSKDPARLKSLENSMETNPVHPLFQEGMYQSIVEDLQDTNYPMTSKGIQWLQQNVLKQTPKVLEEGISQAYMLEGTSSYNFLFEIVQYSDFAARAAHYDLYMSRYVEQYKQAGKEISAVDKAKYSKQLIAELRDIYINYNRPNSRPEQYLDDLGLLMFIKYAKRVNAVITKGLVERPISAVGSIIVQTHLVDTPDMFEGNIFNRASNLFAANMHSPWDNFMTAVVPSLPREAVEAVN